MKENIEQVKKLILDEFDKVSRELKERELNQVKEQIIGNFQIEMENSQTHMINLIYFEINGKAEDVYDFEKNIRNVNLEDVKSLARDAAKKYSLMVLIPEQVK